MVIQLNFKSGKPVYLQVVDQSKAAAASGALRAGEPLPSIRPLAEQLRINRNTVAKAYTELENQGVIETMAGKGCFLGENNSPFKKEVRNKLLADEIDARKKDNSLSKGQRTQLALIAAICPEPELLVLDEPTSGLDPLVRREFNQTVIGAYQEGAPGQRTIFVSTHLITEFEGLIDEFTIIEGGREVLTLESDTARQRYQKIYARFPKEPVLLNLANMQ